MGIFGKNKKNSGVSETLKDADLGCACFGELASPPSSDKPAPSLALDGLRLICFDLISS